MQAYLQLGFLREIESTDLLQLCLDGRFEAVALRVCSQAESTSLITTEVYACMSYSVCKMGTSQQ